MNQSSAQSTPTILCPYCGHTQHTSEHCEQCQGLFEPLSRMATQIAMGPWFIRDDNIPFAPGCSYTIIKRKIQTGKLTAQSIIRGPSTHQFWMHAHQVPGIAHLLGICHQCSAKVTALSRICPDCHATFDSQPYRNELGLQYPTDQAVEQAHVQLEQIKSGQSLQASTPIISESPTVTPAPTPPPADDTIDMIPPILPATPLPVSTAPSKVTAKPHVTDKLTAQKVTNPQDLHQQARKLSITVMAMILCIIVLTVVIVMLFISSQKPGGVTGLSPIKRELGTTGALRLETLPQPNDEVQSPSPALPDPVGSLDLHQLITNVRELEQDEQFDQALTKLREYAETQEDGKLPFDLETEIKRIEQKIARKNAASFFGSN